MTFDWTAIVIAVVAATPGLIALWKKRKIDDATFGERVTETAEKWLKKYEDRITYLEGRIKGMEGDISRQHGVILSQQAEIAQQRSLIALQRDELTQQKRIAVSQQEQINILTTQVYAQENEIQNLWDGARILECQVVDLGEEPVWKVPKRAMEDEQ